MLVTVPPVPDFPEELHGERVVMVGAIYAGQTGDPAVAALTPLGELGTPLGNENGIVNYADLQSSFDGILPDGDRYYMKSHMMDEITDPAIAAFLEQDAAARDEVDMFVVLRTLGGAIARVGADESAFAHRSATFNFSIDTKWTDPARDADGIDWARSMWDAVQPFATGGVYINFAGLEGEAKTDSLVGSSDDRLKEIRSSYDPDGLFEGAAYRP
jgi:hypothetical protein